LTTCDGQQVRAEPLALVVAGDAEPGEHRHRQRAARELLHQIGGQVAEVDLSCGEREEPSDGAVFADEDSGRREVRLLALERLAGKPAIDGRLSRDKRGPRVIAAQPFELEAGREADHHSPRMTRASSRWRSVRRAGSCNACQSAS
jgi:hypothetical protein